MAESIEDIRYKRPLQRLNRRLRRIEPLKFVRGLARRPVRYFFYHVIYLRENSFWKKVKPFIRPFRIKSKEQWDSQYKSGVWNLLYDLREQARYAVLLSYVIHLRPVSSVLDVGCGEGLLYRWLRPFGYAQYTGLDLSEVAIASCASYCDERTRFITANAEEYVPDRIFDVILFGDSLYYLNEPGKVVERYAAHLAKDGIFIVSLCRSGRSEAIRRFLKTNFPLIDETVVTNSKGSWFCLAFRAPPHDLSRTQTLVERALKTMKLLLFRKSA